MRIAVAIDGSENALRAAKHAIFLAKHLPNATIDVIYVVDFSKAKDDFLLAQNFESLTLTREKKLSQIIQLATEAGVQANAKVLKGEPSKEIIQYVNEGPMDLLVLGSRGLNAFQEMILGSVSHKVMKHADCPVTIVK